MRLFFRQWRVLYSLHDYIVLVGGRRTGKSYTAKRFAVKYLKQGINVIYVTPSANMANFSFSSIGTILRNERRLDKSLSINFCCHSIKCGDYYMLFTIPDGNFENIARMYFIDVPIVVVADEIYDIPQLMCQISYLKNKYQLLIKKILISGHPVDNKNTKKNIKSINKKVKVFTWKGKCER